MMRLCRVIDKIVNRGLFVILPLQFFSCHIAHDTEIICYQNFDKAKDFAYSSVTHSSYPDSALVLLNRCMQCDSIKKPVIELKIRVLLDLKKYKEGAKFVDSLAGGDFTYVYKKQLYHDNFLAWESQSRYDTAKRNILYRQMISYQEQYINSKNLDTKEFEEAFLDLYDIKEKYIDTSIIHQEIDSLKKRYPAKSKFFDFFEPN